HDHDSGMISVAVAEDQDFLRFVIADDCPGILPKHHDRAFEVFETLSPNPASDSTGIGLAIVKKAVESYGGTISICSDGGRGAAFEFTWPIRITVEEPVSSGQTQPASEINTHSESSSQ
ncbi:MAG: ATP-binding protein, partial [Planctomycetaceae bacterium]